MKKIFLVALVSLLSNAGFAQDVYREYPEMFEPEVYTRNPAAIPPQPPPPLPTYSSGIYIGVNGGVSYFQSLLSRRYDGVNVIWALAHPNWDWHSYNVNPVIGYDLFYSCQVPIRLELSGTWYRYQTRQQVGVLVLPTGVPGGLNQYANDRVKAGTLLANVYIDWHTPSCFTPYMGIGAGAARIQTRHTGYLLGPLLAPFGPDSAVTTYWSQTHFAWNAILGVSFEASPSFSIQLQASYTDLGKTNFVTNAPNSVFYYTKHLQVYSGDIGVHWRFYC